MKKFLSILPLAFMGLAVSLTSCSEDPEESCNQSPSDIGTCSADDISVCCDDNEVCYYLYQGDKYENEDDIALVCQPSSAQLSAFKIEMDEFTKQLIMEARSAAICK